MRKNLSKNIVNSIIEERKRSKLFDVSIDINLRNYLVRDYMREIDYKNAIRTIDEILTIGRACDNKPEEIRDLINILKFTRVLCMLELHEDLDKLKDTIKKLISENNKYSYIGEIIINILEEIDEESYTKNENELIYSIGYLKNRLIKTSIPEFENYFELQENEIKFLTNKYAENISKYSKIETEIEEIECENNDEDNKVNLNDFSIYNNEEGNEKLIEVNSIGGIIGAVDNLKENEEFNEPANIKLVTEMKPTNYKKEIIDSSLIDGIYFVGKSICEQMVIGNSIKELSEEEIKTISNIFMSISLASMNDIGISKVIEDPESPIIPLMLDIYFNRNCESVNIYFENKNECVTALADTLKRIEKEINDDKGPKIAAKMAFDIIALTGIYAYSNDAILTRYDDGKRNEVEILSEIFYEIFKDFIVNAGEKEEEFKRNNEEDN